MTSTVMVDNTGNHTNKSTKLTTTNKMTKLQHTIQSKWAIDCSFMPNEQCVSYIEVRISYIWWDDVRFVLEQHTLLDVYSATALQHQSLGRHVAPLGHIILIPSQPVCAHTPWCHVLNQFHSLWSDPTEAWTYDLPHIFNIWFKMKHLLWRVITPLNSKFQCVMPKFLLRFMEVA